MKEVMRMVFKSFDGCLFFKRDECYEHEMGILNDKESDILQEHFGADFKYLDELEGRFADCYIGIVYIRDDEHMEILKRLFQKQVHRYGKCISELTIGKSYVLSFDLDNGNVTQCIGIDDFANGVRNMLIDAQEERRNA